MTPASERTRSVNPPLPALRISGAVLPIMDDAFPAPRRRGSCGRWLGRAKALERRAGPAAGAFLGHPGRGSRQSGRYGLEVFRCGPVRGVDRHGFLESFQGFPVPAQLVENHTSGGPLQRLHRTLIVFLAALPSISRNVSFHSSLTSSLCIPRIGSGKSIEAGTGIPR